MNKELEQYLMSGIGKGILIREEGDDLSFVMGILSGVTMGKNETGEIVPIEVKITVGVDAAKNERQILKCYIEEKTIIKIFDTPLTQEASRAQMEEAFNMYRNIGEKADEHE